MAIHKKGPTKRALEAQKTKEEIFNAAIKLFAQYGYDTVTIDDITKYVGVSKGNFYNHFESKDAVLVAQFNQIDDYYDTYLQKLPPDLSASERVLRFISAMCYYTSKICGLNVMKVVYMNQINTGSKAKILVNKSRAIYNIFRSIVQHGQQTGEFTTEMEAEEMVELFARSARSIIYEWCLYDGEIDMETEGHRFMETILQGVKNASYKQNQ